jgi:hypothetical protein
VAAAVLKETMVTEKAVAKIAAKLTAANVRVDYSFTSRLSSSFLKVIDQLNFRMDMQSFSANFVEPHVDRAFCIFRTRDPKRNPKTGRGR